MDKMFTTQEAAAYLGLKPTTLEIWRCRGVGPRFVKLGRAVKYRQSFLDEFIENGTQTSTSEQ